MFPSLLYANLLNYDHREKKMNQDMNLAAINLAEQIKKENPRDIV